MKSKNCLSIQEFTWQGEPIHQLYLFRNQPSFITQCTWRIANVNELEFFTELTNDFVRDRIFQLLIKHTKNNQYIGTVWGYRKNGKVFVSVFIDELYQNHGFVIPVYSIVIPWIFNESGITHIWFEVHRENTRSLRICRRVFEELFDETSAHAIFSVTPQSAQSLLNYFQKPSL